MSRDLGRDVPDLEKLYARKLWADFSHPKESQLSASCASNLVSALPLQRLVWAEGLSSMCAVHP